jgi:hypothetical protein
VKNRFTRIYLCGSLCVAVVLSCCLVGQAQSGRRSPKPLSPPTPTAPTTPPPKESETPTTPEKPPLKQRTVIVGMDAQSTAYYIQPYFADAVMRGFTAKFNTMSSIKLTVETSMRRKQAVERAKKETETFVVLLQLATDNMGGSLGDVSPENLIVAYLVFSPVTGKVKDQGRVYIRPSRSIIGQRLPTSRTVDAQLMEAGREAATRVLPALHNESPTIRR